jgi:hypothetical protein
MGVSIKYQALVPTMHEHLRASDKVSNLRA